MDNLTDKYLNRIRGFFIGIGILASFIAFLAVPFLLIGAGMGETLALPAAIFFIIIPLAYFMTAFNIKRKKKIVWVGAIVLSIIPIIHSSSVFVRYILHHSENILFFIFPIIGQMMVIGELLVGVFLLVHLLKKEVKNYYFLKT